MACTRLLPLRRGLCGGLMRCRPFSTSSPKESMLKVPEPKEMQEMVSKALTYLEKDLHEPKPASGTGYRWIHSHDKDEMMKMFEIYKIFQEPVPEKGMAYDDLLAHYFKYMPYSTADNQGGYMCWAPTGGLFASALADFIASSTNRSSTMFMVAPWAASIEDTVIQWFCDIIGYPKDSNRGGVLTSGGSLANFQAIHAARDQCMEKPEDILDLTVYVCEQAHYCIAQGTAMCGIPERNLRYIPSNDDCSMKTELLEEAIVKDLDKGLKPMMAVAMLGSTNSGAVDNLYQMAEICQKYKLWFHADGALGAMFGITDRGKQLLKGMELADSVVLDPHKTLFMPYGTGSIVVKDKSTLLNVNSHTSACMHKGMPSDFPPDIMNLGPELTRNFRGLSVWLPLKLYGMEAFRNELDIKLDLTQWAASQIEQIPHIKLVHRPNVTVFAFKLEPKHLLAKDVLTPVELDEMNKLFLDSINKRGNCILSAFRSIKNVPGEFCARMAIQSYRTQKEHVQTAINDITEAAEEVIQIYSDIIDTKMKTNSE